ncbi:hypothetical protein [Vallitalea okinawensis]|uniref:hypothetical protein n=1 Tax=Vallitalea okinawensis TaxID=2078660 RepID=UPI000CFA8F81|nr:hypothetical protein [Vallitalea okinawensis]
MNPYTPPHMNNQGFHTDQSQQKQRQQAPPYHPFGSGNQQYQNNGPQTPPTQGSDPTPSPTAPTRNNNFDFGKLMPMLELLSGMYKQQSGINFGSNLHNDQTPAPVNEFENAINTQEMKILKSAIPFLDHNVSRQIAMLVKMMELRNTMDYYDKPSEELMRQEKDPNWKKNMLLSMRAHLTEDRKAIIDYAIKSLDMRDLVDHFNKIQTNKSEEPKQDSTPSKPKENDDLNAKLKGMLTPDQQQMFNTFSGMMNGMKK